MNRSGIVSDHGSVGRAVRTPGLTLRTIELLTKLEADVASILGAPPVPVPRYAYGRTVSAYLRHGRMRDS